MRRRLDDQLTCSRPPAIVRALLIEAEAAVTDAYWIFSRSLSAKVGPPAPHLYADRRLLRGELAAHKRAVQHA